MSRFLLATLGSLGDLHPYIAVARALIGRGHEAVIACTEEYRDPVLNAGVEFSPVRPRLADLGDYRTLVTRIFNKHRGPERLIRLLVMPYLRASYEDILQASHGADLLVSHPLTFTLQLVAHQRKLPWVATVLAPLSFMSHHDPPLLGAAPWLRSLRILGPRYYGLLFDLLKRVGWRWEAPLRKFRAELGLPPSRHMAMFEGQFSPLLNLALFDPQLAKPQPDWPPNTAVCGSAVFTGSSPGQQSLDELNRFLVEGEAPIVFALGSSAVWVAGDFWIRAVKAAEQLRRRSILLTGPTQLQSLPASAKAFPYLPYEKVFPHASAVVHQAGIGTLSQALRSGRPQLIVPLAFDQPDNAARAESLGVARAIPFTKATARLLVSELETLHSRPSYAARSSTIAAELATSDGAACAAERLIACLNSNA